MAEIHAGSYTENHVIPDNPAPCRALGLYANDLLVVVMIHDPELFERNVMRPCGVPFRFHAVDFQAPRRFFDILLMRAEDDRRAAAISGWQDSRKGSPDKFQRGKMTRVREPAVSLRTNANKDGTATVASP